MDFYKMSIDERSVLEELRNLIKERSKFGRRKALSLAHRGTLFKRVKHKTSSSVRSVHALNSLIWSLKAKSRARTDQQLIDLYFKYNGTGYLAVSGTENISEMERCVLRRMIREHTIYDMIRHSFGCDIPSSLDFTDVILLSAISQSLRRRYDTKKSKVLIARAIDAGHLTIADLHQCRVTSQFTPSDLDCAIARDFSLGDTVRNIARTAGMTERQIHYRLNTLRTKKGFHSDTEFMAWMKLNLFV